MKDKEKAIKWFENIAYECDKLTSGNVAHLRAQIKGMAIRSAEYLTKHSQEPASEDLEQAAEQALKAYPRTDDAWGDEWQKRVGFVEGYNQAEKDLGWHSIEESLPPYDEEVIALTDMMHGKQLSSARCICYAHRPNPKGYNGKSIITGKVSHYEFMTYNGWNIEGVKYWMPCPKIPE